LKGIHRLGNPLRLGESRTTVQAYEGARRRKPV
jgi:hypothetical protein